MDNRGFQYLACGASLGRGAILAFALLSAAWVLADEHEPGPPYPDGFRHWVHVKSAAVTPAHPAYATEGGLHHIYANPQAVQGYSTGRFPDGAVIAYELLSTVEKDGVISEGARRRVDVMAKDEKRYKATGGWGFNRFYPGNDREGALRGSAGANMCFECHKSSGAREFVFSRERP